MNKLVALCVFALLCIFSSSVAADGNLRGNEEIVNAAEIEMEEMALEDPSDQRRGLIWYMVFLLNKACPKGPLGKSCGGGSSGSSSGSSSSSGGSSSSSSSSYRTDDGVAADGGDDLQVDESNTNLSGGSIKEQANGGSLKSRSLVFLLVAAGAALTAGAAAFAGTRSASRSKKHVLKGAVKNRLTTFQTFADQALCGCAEQSVELSPSGASGDYRLA
mmetsp:Transcript_5670/g.8715  ORF Transcript_5670/g.8715 Transcript_5670/m.8715 type:complete len:218 (-) Transcript_5670:1749-2402(-)|eukprot:CAMPEP_0118706986 /NCGR_PEP_ID=MMETSP0800-20121206/20911_1 /TAXON_ID=210618 ORGANISM="Striatella unipunctata, Strain CCMP2910" /NCGR_SAMPLE_ID=MMETSP0800 /ASSEMBLY_ACC=CAM_ASM_000638 /LENGTH=217 /DNA_ID=CAMNT_0006609679 /DNA_START=168 /DNA_END=821 /DNA_ORIENTATION=+